MRRVQLYMDEAAYAEARLRAAEQGVSVASVAREAMAEYLSKQPPPVPWGDDPLDRLAGAWRDGPRDGARKADEVVYDPPPRRRPA